MCTKQARTFYNSFLSPPPFPRLAVRACTRTHARAHTTHTSRRTRSRGAASRDGSGTTHRPPGSPGVTCLEASQRKSRPLRYGVWIKYYFRAYTPAGRDGRRRLPGTPSSPRLKRTWRGKTPANWLTRGDMGELRWSLVCRNKNFCHDENVCPFFPFFYFISHSFCFWKLFWRSWFVALRGIFFFLFYVSFVFENRLGDRGSMPEEIVIKDIVKMVSLMIINTVFAGL